MFLQELGSSRPGMNDRNGYRRPRTGDRPRVCDPHRTRPIGRALQGIVVENDGVVFASQTHVAFDPATAEFGRLAETDEGVLGRS